MTLFEVIYPAVMHLAIPANIPDRTMQQLADLIATGTEVDMAMVGRNLKSAASIAWAEQDGRACGVIVLKQPLPAYRDKVFEAAGVPELAQKYRFELGYTYVEPAQRSQGTSVKLGRLMVRDLNGPVFATTRANNTTVNKLLNFIGFKQLGQPYTSQRGDYNLILWGNR